MRASPVLAAVIAVACGREPAPATPSARAVVARPEVSSPRGSDPAAATAPAPDRFEPSGPPQLVTAEAALWADATRGIVARAPRDPSTGAIGEARVVARDRRAPAHLAREDDGDLYWVEYRREDARCDFVRLPATPEARPELLFEEDLGDFSELACETDLAVDPTRLYWLHGSEVRSASHAASPVAIGTLARGERFPREIAVDATHVYWTVMGADPYEDDLTGRGALRALRIPQAGPAGARARSLAAGLTEPSDLTIDGSRITLREVGGAGEALRSYPAVGAQSF